MLINTSFTVPACDEGTSIVALSVSKVIKPSSASITSPTATSTSMTSTSPSSPISGTAISITSLLAAGADFSAAGAGVSAGASAVELVSAGAPDEVSSLITIEPCLTLSPVLMKTSFTVPACGEGTSIVALSVSSVIKPSSASITSPAATSTSITSTSPSSPISGTAISITSLLVAAAGAFSSAGASACSAFGSDFCSGSASFGASSALLVAAPFISAITSPSLILSPTFTESATSSPANGAGISIEALSVSTVIIPSSASKLSPTAKHISITSTSSPPTSGTRIFSISDIS